MSPGNITGMTDTYVHRHAQEPETHLHPISVRLYWRARDGLRELVGMCVFAPETQRAITRTCARLNRFSLIKSKANACRLFPTPIDHVARGYCPGVKVRWRHTETHRTKEGRSRAATCLLWRPVYAELGHMCRVKLHLSCTGKGPALA